MSRYSCLQGAVDATQKTNSFDPYMPKDLQVPDHTNHSSGGSSRHRPLQGPPPPLPIPEMTVEQMPVTADMGSPARVILPDVGLTGDGYPV